MKSRTTVERQPRDHAVAERDREELGDPGAPADVDADPPWPTSDRDSCELARHELLDALTGVVLPDTVVATYGETIDPERVLRHLLAYADQPTLAALAAIVRATKRAALDPGVPLGLISERAM